MREKKCDLYLGGLHKASEIHRPGGEQESENVKDKESRQHNPGVCGIQTGGDTCHPSHVKNRKRPHIQP
jgi:hypothetical protein